jgi:hypothetical protein
MEQLTMNNPRRIQRHLVKALAAGALLAAAALPLAIATEAGAVTAPTLTSIAFTPHGATANSYGSGASGTVAITGTNFAHDGGNVTLTSSAGDLTFTSVTETSTTTATANFADTGSTAGSYTATLTDDNGGSGAVTGAVVVDAGPTIGTIAPAAIYEGTGANTVTIPGTGFQTGATVSFANNGNGTPLTATVTTVSATAIVLSVTPTNSATSAPASTGAYTATVTNPDGGTVTGGTLSVLNGIQEISPSAEPGSSTATSYTVTITGAGFQYGATVTVTGCSDVTGVASSTVNSANSVTAVLRPPAW